MHEKGSIVKGGSKDRTLKLIAGYPSGLNPQQVCDSLGISKQAASDVLWELGRDGFLSSVEDPAGKMTRRKRWCLPEHIETCREAVGRKGGGTKPPNLKTADIKRFASTPEEKINGMSKPAQSCGSFVPIPPDLRFTVAAPVPFFSKPGYRTDMLKTGSALEAAYGGGND